MDANVLKLGGTNLVDSIIKQIGLEAGSLKLISETENFIYDYKGVFILRVSPISHRNIEEIYAELDWIDFLNENGVTAAQVVKIKENKSILHFETHNVQFYGVFFKKLRGRNLINSDIAEMDVGLDEYTYNLWGRTLGKMHKIAKQYHPLNTRFVRKQWDQVIPKILRDEDKEKNIHVLQKQAKLIEYLKQLPIDSDSYGLIHSDFSYNNFFINDSRIYVFDFDHCKYHWFIYDIAIIMDCIRYLPRYADEDMFSKQFFKYFIEGYMQENTLDKFWIDQLPEFCKLWRIDNFIPIINKIDYKIIESWEERLLKKMKMDIEKEKSYFKLV